MTNVYLEKVASESTHDTAKKFAIGGALGVAGGLLAKKLGAKSMVKLKAAGERTYQRKVTALNDKFRDIKSSDLYHGNDHFEAMKARSNINYKHDRYRRRLDSLSQRQSRAWVKARDVRDVGIAGAGLSGGVAMGGTTIALATRKNKYHEKAAALAGQ